MRKFIFGICLLLLVFLLVYTSSQMPPASIAFAAGPLDHFIFSDISTQTAGRAFEITITAVDADGNTDTTYVGMNILDVSTGTISPTTTDAFSAGSWTGQVTITEAATEVTISTSGSKKTGESNSITIIPGPLFRFTITDYPISVTAGENFGINNVVVTAYDAYGNIKTNYQGSVYFSSTDAQAVLPYVSGSLYTFTSQDNGIHTFSGTGFKLSTPPSQTITVTDGFISATSNSITVTSSIRTITITSNPAGSGYIEVDGIAYVTPAIFNWTIGDRHVLFANSSVIITNNQSRYVYLSWSDHGSQSHRITVSYTSPSTYTANFQLQYYLSVSGGNGNGAGWYNSGALASSTANYVMDQISGQSRNNLYQRIIDGVPTPLPRANSGTFTQFFTMSTYHTIVWSYRVQYYLTNNLVSGSLNSITASPTEDGWYDNATSVSVALNNVWSIVTNQSRSNLLQFFNGTVSMTVARAGTGTTNFNISVTTYRRIYDTSIRQYYLNVIGGGSISYGITSPTSDNWYDPGTSTTVTSSYIWNTVSGQSRTIMTSYSIDGFHQTLTRQTNGTLTTPPIIMTRYHMVTFSSVTQYFLNVTGGNSVFYGTDSPTSDNWYDSGTSTTVSSLWVWNTVSNQSRLAITNWQLDGINQNTTRRNTGNLTTDSISMSTYHSVNFVSTIQYYLIVSGGNNVTLGIASPTSDNWYDSGTSITISSNWIWDVVPEKSGIAITNWQLDNFNQTVLFINGFENGTSNGFTAWNYTHASGTGSTTIESLSPYSGTFESKFVSDAGGFSHCVQIFEPSSVAYARAYYRFSTLNLGSWDLLGLLRLSHGNHTNSVTAQILYHDGNYYWQLTTSDGSNSYHDRSVASNITTGVWYCIEIKRDVINGLEELWVDGVSMVSAAHNITGKTNQLEVGITYGGNLSGTGNTCYVDDVVIIGDYKALGGPKTLSPQGVETLAIPSITMSTHHTVNFSSKSQFYLFVNSTFSIAGGEGWYDSGSKAYATLVNGTVFREYGIRYIFLSWIGDASGLGLKSGPITMDSAKIATATWKKQYTIVLSEGMLFSTSILDSNSTVTGLAYNLTNRTLSFTVNGASGTKGYVNITIAMSLIGDINEVMVYLDGEPTNFNFVSVDGSWLLQFTYQHSEHRVDVSLGSAPLIIGSVVLSPLIKSVISMIGVTSGAVLFISVAWLLIGEARRRHQKQPQKAVKERISRLPTC